MVSEKEYKDYCNRYRKVMSYLKGYSKPSYQVALEICAIRGYNPNRMVSVLEDAGFMFIQDENCLSKLKDSPYIYDLGLFNEEGNFILKGRYIFPICDMLGNTIALVGWYPDSKRYITTPSRFFSKNLLFYGLEQLSRTGVGKPYFLVEGIFDSLSIRSLGLPCIAQMGINTSKYKKVMYSLFGRVLAIPDNDSEGRKVWQEDRWGIPSNSAYMKWSGGNCKDVDDICKTYVPEDVRDLLVSSFNDKTSRIVTRNLEL